MKHYIIGHQKPDLDSVVAAISLAKYFEKIGDTTGTPVIAGPINPETEFVFKKFNLTPPPILNLSQITAEDRILLVDHNEVEQRMDGLNEDQISGIVDHHKVNLNLNTPITIDIKPWGSTNTIIYHKFKLHNLEIDQQTATLMLTAILSDTVGLKSATTTKKDSEAVDALKTIANIQDLDALTLEIFKAKSNVTALSPEEIVRNDYKVFDFNKKTFIGQLETVEQEEILTGKKAELLQAMEKIKKEEGVDLIFLAITDILKVNTKLICLSDAETQVAQKAFSTTVTDNVTDIGAKLSRKKEIAPPIEEALK